VISELQNKFFPCLEDSPGLVVGSFNSGFLGGQGKLPNLPDRFTNQRMIKRTILAPLLSAFVLPGLGQIINRQFRKAGVLMAAVSLLFLSLVFKLLYDLNKVLLTLPMEALEKTPHPFALVARSLSQRDKTWLIALLLILMAVWVYGVLDAYIIAQKTDRVKSQCANS
jgi:hypothetical protein